MGLAFTLGGITMILLVFAVIGYAIYKVYKKNQREETSRDLTDLSFFCWSLFLKKTISSLISLR